MGFSGEIESQVLCTVIAKQVRYTVCQMVTGTMMKKEAEMERRQGSEGGGEDSLKQSIHS